jgi:hypothetical protein
MPLTFRPALPAMAALLALAGCNESEPPAAPPAKDPALTGALADQIMVDPELVGQNQANSAITAADSNSVTQPAPAGGTEAIAAAKAEAAKLAGGAIQSAPAPTPGDGKALAADAATAAQLATVADKSQADCAGKVEYSAHWATALPEPLGVYPRGAVSEAAGTDQAGCRLRVVSFTTPVPPQDVVDFYYTRLRKAGYGAAHRLDGKDHVLGGRKAASAYVVYARPAEDGMTEVDVVAGG